MNSGIRILGSYFRSRQFLSALFLCALVVMLTAVPLIVYATRYLQDLHVVRFLITGVTLPMFGMYFLFSLGTFLKTLVATPFAIALPYGRVKPVLTILLFAVIVTVIATSLIAQPRLDSYGLAALVLFIAVAVMLAGYWQGPWLGLAPLVIILFGRNVDVPFFTLLNGGHEGYATFYLLLSAVLLGLLAYRALRLSEEKTEYRWSQFGNLSRRNRRLLDPAARSPRIARISDFLNPPRDYHGSKYDNRHFLQRFFHLRGSFGQSLFSLPLIVLVFLCNVYFAHSVHRQHDLYFLFLYFPIISGPFAFLNQRFMFYQLEKTLPLSCRQYTLNFAGIIILANFSLWLTVSLSVLLFVGLFNQNELTHPLLWAHLTLSFCLALFSFSSTSIVAYYFGRNGMKFCTFLLFMPVYMLIVSPDSLAAPDIGLYFEVALGFLLAGMFLLAASYRIWMKGDPVLAAPTA